MSQIITHFMGIVRDIFESKNRSIINQNACHFKQPSRAILEAKTTQEYKRANILV